MISKRKKAFITAFGAFCAALPGGMASPAGADCPPGEPRAEEFFSSQTDTGRFELLRVSPRVFTPEVPAGEINRARFYFENPGFKEVSISIYDITGRLVRGTLPRESENIIFWDGRSSGGRVSPMGVYIYSAEAGGRVFTGIVEIAK